LELEALNESNNFKSVEREKELSEEVEKLKQEKLNLEVKKTQLIIYGLWQITPVETGPDAYERRVKSFAETHKLTADEVRNSIAKSELMIKQFNEAKGENRQQSE
jgi:hypothetical protein